LKESLGQTKKQAGIANKHSQSFTLALQLGIIRAAFFISQTF
jgi:hypothetical protein